MPDSAYIDPAIEALLKKARDANRKPFWQGTPAQARANPTLMKALFGDVPAVHKTLDLEIPRGKDVVRARAYIPKERPDGMIVYFHGGGWVIGSVAEYEAFTATLANRTRCAVLSVDYRLAPEHPYPAPLDDARAVIEFVARSDGAVLGTGDGAMIVAGDSAGANLATVAVCMQHHARPSDRRFDLQILVYPVTDAVFDTPSYQQFAEGKLLTRRDMQWFWDHYAPDVSGRTSPLLSPVRSESLHASPPALVMTAALDPLRDEGERYAERLREAGVDVQLVRCEGLVHGFLAMSRISAEAEKALDRIVEAVTHTTKGSTWATRLPGA